MVLPKFRLCSSAKLIYLTGSWLVAMLSVLPNSSNLFFVTTWVIRKNKIRVNLIPLLYLNPFNGSFFVLWQENSWALWIVMISPFCLLPLLSPAPGFSPTKPTGVSQTHIHIMFISAPGMFVPILNIYPIIHQTILLFELIFISHIKIKAPLEQNTLLTHLWVPIQKKASNI